MPRFKGSCGCYRRDDAEKYGVIAAIVLDDICDKYEYYELEGELVDGFFYLSQTNRADALCIPRKSYGTALALLQEKGRIEKKIGYKPNTAVKATWVKVLPDAFSLGENDQSRLGENDQSIYNDTNNDTNGGGSIIDFGMMKAVIQKFVRDHQSQSSPITFTPSKLKEYYPSLKEWAIDNGIKLDRVKVLTVLENALDEMQNDGWLAGKDLAIAFKDTCIGSRINKQQKKGGLNDNEWV